MSPYEQSVNGLTLTEIYREQDRLEREIQTWERVPGGCSQIRLREERLAALDRLLAKRYEESRGTTNSRRLPLV